MTQIRCDVHRRLLTFEHRWISGLCSNEIWSETFVQQWFIWKENIRTICSIFVTVFESFLSLFVRLTNRRVHFHWWNEPLNILLFLPFSVVACVPSRPVCAVPSAFLFSRLRMIKLNISLTILSANKNVVASSTSMNQRDLCLINRLIIIVHINALIITQCIAFLFVFTMMISSRKSNGCDTIRSNLDAFSHIAVFFIHIASSNKFALWFQIDQGTREGERQRQREGRENEKDAVTDDYPLFTYRFMLISSTGEHTGREKEKTKMKSMLECVR